MTPSALGLLAEGDRVNAGLTALARAIGFIPLVATTAITTGVYAPAGMTFVFVIGLLIPNPFIALIAGAACICVEILLLNVICKGSGQVPRHQALRRQHPYRYELRHRHRPADRRHPGCSGNHAHDGSVHHRGILVLNKCSKKPLVSMAVGPLGAILVGLIANVLFLLSLYTPAA